MARQCRKQETLELGKWYQSNAYKEYYFKFVGRNKNGFLLGHYVNIGGLTHFNEHHIITSLITNQQFWEDCTQISDCTIADMMTPELAKKEFPHLFELYPIFN